MDPLDENNQRGTNGNSGRISDALVDAFRPIASTDAPQSRTKAVTRPAAWKAGVGLV